MGRSTWVGAHGSEVGSLARAAVSRLPEADILHLFCEPRSDLSSIISMVQHGAEGVPSRHDLAWKRQKDYSIGLQRAGKRQKDFSRGGACTTTPTHGSQGPLPCTTTPMPG
eukprot:358473-Chlamydomonas_euryale.AAC.3